jgi:hypothetical protein
MQNPPDRLLSEREIELWEVVGDALMYIVSFAVWNAIWCRVLADVARRAEDAEAQRLIDEAPRA